MLHKGEGAIGANNNLIDQKSVQVRSERGIAIALDDTFERVAILTTYRNCRLRVYLLISCKHTCQHQILLDCLALERRFKQYGITPEELIDKARGIVCLDLDSRRNLACNGVCGCRDSLARSTEVAGAATLIDLIGIDNRFVAVALVDIVWEDGIRNALKVAYLTTQPYIAGRDG